MSLSIRPVVGGSDPQIVRQSATVPALLASATLSSPTITTTSNESAFKRVYRYVFSDANRAITNDGVPQRVFPVALPAITTPVRLTGHIELSAGGLTGTSDMTFTMSEIAPAATSSMGLIAMIQNYEITHALAWPDDDFVTVSSESMSIYFDFVLAGGLPAGSGIMLSQAFDGPLYVGPGSWLEVSDAGTCGPWTTV